MRAKASVNTVDRTEAPQSLPPKMLKWLFINRNYSSSYCFLLLLSYHKNPPCQRHFSAYKCQWYDEHEINQIPCKNIFYTQTSVGINQNRDEMHTEDYH